jgi:hypothetical protein
MFFELFVYLFEFVTTKKFRDKLEVWLFHSLLDKMRIGVFKTDKSEGLGDILNDEGIYHFECYLPKYDEIGFFNQFIDVPHKLVYFDRSVKHFGNVSVRFGSIEAYAEKGGVSPNMMIYFDGWVSERSELNRRLGALRLTVGCDR